MKVSPPTLIGGIITLIAALFIPVVYFFLQSVYAVESLEVTLFTIFPHPLVTVPLESAYIEIHMNVFILPELLLVAGGILGIIGGAIQHKVLKITSGVIGLAGCALICYWLLWYLNDSAISPLTGYTLLIVPYPGLYIALAGAILSLVGLIVKKNA